MEVLQRPENRIKTQIIITKTDQLGSRNRKHHPITVKITTSIDLLKTYYAPENVIVTYFVLATNL